MSYFFINNSILIVARSLHIRFSLYCNNQRCETRSFVFKVFKTRDVVSNDYQVLFHSQGRGMSFIFMKYYFIFQVVCSVYDSLFSRHNQETSHINQSTEKYQTNKTGNFKMYMYKALSKKRNLGYRISLESSEQGALV